MFDSSLFLKNDAGEGDGGDLELAKRKKGDLRQTVNRMSGQFNNEDEISVAGWRLFFVNGRRSTQAEAYKYWSRLVSHACFHLPLALVTWSSMSKMRRRVGERSWGDWRQCCESH